MRPVDQTKFGGETAPPDEHGNCFAACIASLLEVPLDAVPDPSPTLPYAEWEAVWLDALSKRNLWMVGLQVDPEDPEGLWWLSPGFWIASIPSLNLVTENGDPDRHAVVMRGDSLAHDPSPRNRRERVDRKDILAVRWLIPIDPAASRQEGED